MQSSITCAFAGSFGVAGGVCAVLWTFLRALALHLQICWQITIGKKFMWGALTAGWGIPAVVVTVALIFSGVSFRFGPTCYINYENSLAAYWIPLLAFAGFTAILQLCTFAYCIKVYLASLRDDSRTGSSSRNNISTEERTISPRQAYRRVRRVIELQWRGIVIVLLILVDVILFAFVSVFMNNLSTSALKSPTKALDWLGCLAASGNKHACIKLAAELTVNDATVAATLLLLSVGQLWRKLQLA